MEVKQHQKEGEGGDRGLKEAENAETEETGPERAACNERREQGAMTCLTIVS